MTNKDRIAEMNDRDAILAQANASRWEFGENIHDALVESIYAEANSIASRAIALPAGKTRFDLNKKLDLLITSRWFGFPLMFLLLAVVLWLTVEGANVPSAMIASFLVDTLHPWLKDAAALAGSPWWLTGVLVDGVWDSGARGRGGASPAAEGGD